MRIRSNPPLFHSTSRGGLEADLNRIVLIFIWGYTYHKIFGLLICLA